MWFNSRSPGAGRGWAFPFSRQYMWIVSFYTAANKQIALFSSYFKYFPCVYVTERKLHLCVSKSNVKVYMTDIFYLPDRI